MSEGYFLANQGFPSSSAANPATPAHFVHDHDDAGGVESAEEDGPDHHKIRVQVTW
jgi:hypothetical protein